MWYYRRSMPASCLCGMIALLLAYTHTAPTPKEVNATVLSQMAVLFVPFEPFLKQA
jgi:hypothetical protein